MTENELYDTLKTLQIKVIRGPSFGIPLPTLSFSLKTEHGKEEILILLRAKTAEENDDTEKQCSAKLSRYGFYESEKKCERERDSGTFLHHLKYRLGSFTAIKINGEQLSCVVDTHLKGGSAPVLHADGLYKAPTLNISRLKATLLSPVPNSMLSGVMDISVNEKPYKGLLRELIQKDGASQIILDIWEEDA